MAVRHESDVIALPDMVRAGDGRGIGDVMADWGRVDPYSNGTIAFEEKRLAS
jgi:hypothetical protein